VMVLVVVAGMSAMMEVTTAVSTKRFRLAATEAVGVLTSLSLSRILGWRRRSMLHVVVLVVVAGMSALVEVSTTMAKRFRLAAIEVVGVLTLLGALAHSVVTSVAVVTSSVPSATVTTSTVKWKRFTGRDNVESFSLKDWSGPRGLQKSEYERDLSDRELHGDEYLVGDMLSLKSIDVTWTSLGNDVW